MASTSHVNHTYPNPDQATTQGLLRAADLSNEANHLRNQNKREEALPKLLEALRLKIEHTGEKSVQTGMTRNALGEIYMEMGNADEAKVHLEEALECRNKLPNFDTAVTRENLGQMWEMKGDLLKAREIRNAGGPNAMACGNPKCPGEMYKRSEVKACGRCNSIYYHGKACQRMDWARHKKWCKKVEA